MYRKITKKKKELITASISFAFFRGSPASHVSGCHSEIEFRVLSLFPGFKHSLKSLYVLRHKKKKHQTSLGGVLQLLLARHPDGVATLLLDAVLDALVHLVGGVAAHDGGEVLAKVGLELVGPLEGLPRLVLAHPLVHLQDGLDGLGLEEDGHGVEPGHVEALDGVGRDVEDAVLALLRHVDHRLHRRAVQVLVVLPRLDEEMRWKEEGENGENVVSRDEYSPHQNSVAAEAPKCVTGIQCLRAPEIVRTAEVQICRTEASKRMVGIRP